MSERKLTIDPIVGIKAKADIDQVLVIGCGGTGGFFIRDIARSISTMKVQPELVLIDGDTVEEKNLKRQNFIAADIGRNKADVLAGRYSTLGLKVAFSGKFLEKAEDLQAILDTKKCSLIVSCVDNVKTRALIRQAYLGSKQACSYWIDCGNEEFTGQVVLGCKANNWTPETMRAGQYPVPDVFDLYPELHERAKIDKLPTEMSCAELAAASPQYGFVNATAAVFAINFAHDLLMKSEITTHMVEFTIKNKFSHRSPSRSALIGWKKTFTPIAAHNFEKMWEKPGFAPLPPAEKFVPIVTFN